MLHALRGLGLAAILLAISSAAAIRHAAAQSTTSAYVYVQTQGQAGPVYAYAGSSGGKLTAISGSPFKPGTHIIGATGTKLFTLGKTTLHAYALGSNGAVGAQEGQIGVINYPGGEGQYILVQGAILDHSGQYIYVSIVNGSCGCQAYQTYRVNKDGSFTFDGDTEKTLNNNDGDDLGLPSILGSETFGYATEWIGHY